MNRPPLKSYLGHPSMQGRVQPQQSQESTTDNKPAKQNPFANRQTSGPVSSLTTNSPETASMVLWTTQSRSRTSPGLSCRTSECSYHKPTMWTPHTNKFPTLSFPLSPWDERMPRSNSHILLPLFCLTKEVISRKPICSSQ